MQEQPDNNTVILQQAEALVQDAEDLSPDEKAQFIEQIQSKRKEFGIEVSTVTPGELPDPTVVTPAEPQLETDPAVEGNVQKGSVSLSEVIDTAVDTGVGLYGGAIDSGRELINTVTMGNVANDKPIYEPHTGMGKAAYELTKLATGFVGGRGIIKGAGYLPKVGKTLQKAPGLVKEGLSDLTQAGLFFDEHAQTMGNLVQDVFKVDNPFAVDADDSFWEGKLKQLGDAAVGSTIGVAVLKSFKAFKNLRTAIKNGDEAAALKISNEEIPKTMKEALDAQYPSKVGPELPFDDLPDDVKVDAETFAKTFKKTKATGKTFDDININPQTLEDPEKASQIIKAIEEQAGPIGGKKQTVKWIEQEDKALEWIDENISSLSDLTGETREALEYQLLRDAKNAQSAQVRIVATTAILNKQVQELDKLASLYQADPTNKEILAKIARLKDSFQKVGGSYRNITSEFGRGLNLAKNSAERITPDLGSLLDADQGTEEWLMAYNAASLKGKRQAMWQAAGQGLNAFRISNMVGNTMTQAANVVGNIYMTVAKPAEMIVGGAVADRKTMKEGVALYAGMSKYYSEALSNTLMVLKTAKPILRGAGTTTESVNYHKTAFELLGDMMEGSFGKRAPQVLKKPVNALGSVGTFGNRLLAAGDEFFVQLNYRSKIYADAIAEGIEQGIDPKSTTLQEFAEQRVTQSVDPVTGLYKNQEGFDFAADQTFSKDFGDDENGFFVAGGKWVQSAKNSNNPALKAMSNLFFPFVRTPVRVFEEGTSRIPFAQMSDVIKGNPKQRAEAIGKFASGTFLVGTAGMLAASGQMTGRLPTDPNERRSWQAAGFRPYTLYIGGKGKDGSQQIPLSRFGPFSIPMMLTADAVMAGEQISEGEVEDAVTGAIASVVSNVESATFMQGLENLGNILSKASQGEADETALANMVTQFIPMSSALRDFDSLPLVGDPYMRDAKGIIDRAYERIPGYGDNIPKRRDVLGNPLDRPILNFFKTSKMSPAQEEIARLVDLGANFTPIPQSIGASSQLNLYEYVNPKTGQKALDKYGELINTIAPEGKTLNDRIIELIQSPEYTELGEPGSSSEGRKIQGGKAQAIRDLIQVYRSAAREYLKTEPDFIKEYMGDDGQQYQENILDAIVRMEQEDMNAYLAPDDDGEDQQESDESPAGLAQQFMQTMQ